MERPDLAVFDGVAANERMSQHIHGYILAMDDILRDLDFLRLSPESDTAIIEDLEKGIIESRASAMRTLDTIIKKIGTAE